MGRCLTSNLWLLTPGEAACFAKKKEDLCFSVTQISLKIFSHFGFDSARTTREDEDYTLAGRCAARIFSRVG